MASTNTPGQGNGNGNQGNTGPGLPGNSEFGQGQGNGNQDNPNSNVTASESADQAAERLGLYAGAGRLSQGHGLALGHFNPHNPHAVTDLLVPDTTLTTNPLATPDPESPQSNTDA